MAFTGRDYTPQQQKRYQLISDVYYWYDIQDLNTITFEINQNTPTLLHFCTVSDENFQSHLQSIQAFIGTANESVRLCSTPVYFTTVIFVNENHWDLLIYDPKRKQAGIYDLHIRGFGNQEKREIIKAITATEPAVRVFNKALGMYEDDEFCGPAVCVFLEILSQFPPASLEEITSGWLKKKLKSMHFSENGILTLHDKMRVRKKYAEMIIRDNYQRIDQQSYEMLGMIFPPTIVEDLPISISKFKPFLPIFLQDSDRYHMQIATLMQEVSDIHSQLKQLSQWQIGIKYEIVFNHFLISCMMHDRPVVNVKPPQSYEIPTQLPDDDIQRVKNYIAESTPENLQNIVDNIAANKLSVIFKYLSEEHEPERLETAQVAIYEAISQSNKLHTYHRLRIALAIAIGCSVVFSPLLFVVIPWIQKRKQETLLEVRQVSTDELHNIKKMRKQFKIESSDGGVLFNKQGELKAAKIVGSGRCTLFMNKEQAVRFDYLRQYTGNSNKAPGIKRNATNTLFISKQKSSQQIKEVANFYKKRRR